MVDLKAVRQRMEKAVEVVRQEFATVRTGKATPTLLDVVKVEAYGTTLPIQQVAQVTAPEPRLLVVQPFDRGLIGAIERAIRESDLGLNPMNDGKVIRVPVPPLTEERRRELARVLHKMAEEGRVAVRRVRHDANEEIKRLQKERQLSEDDARRLFDEVQKLTDRYIEKIDELLERKEAEVMEV
jgi:ribosome recycling factor